MTRPAALAAAAGVLAIAGCGGSDEPSTPPGVAVHRAAAELRRAPWAFDVDYRRARADTPGTRVTFATAGGRADVRARTGSMRIDLRRLLQGSRTRGPTPKELRAPLDVRWRGRTVTVLSGGRPVQGGLVRRFATEPAALARLLAAATGARHVGGAEVGGVAAERYTFSAGWVPPAALVAAAADGSRPAGRVGVDVWVADGGRPLRIAYSAGLSDVRGAAGQTIFPPTTVTATYELRPAESP